MSKRVKFISFTFLLWTLWVLFYALVMYIQVKEIPFLIAIISSANYNYIFALLSILIWSICKRFPFDKINKLLFVSMHFILAILFSVLWLFLAYGFWYLAEGKVIFERIDFQSIIGWQFLFGMIQYFLVAGIFYTIIYYRNYKQKELQEAELKILTRDAELKALKLQMNPHFLFNSLNSINALITRNPSLARKMISRLSELLRMSLETHDQLLIPLKQELNLVHQYLEIERIRFEDKMIYKEEIEPGLLSKPFPAMLLQPLLENAVKHGIANSRSGGVIELKIFKNHNRMQGTIVNTSSDKSQLKNIKSNGNGMGISNIRSRLDRLYGNSYLLQIDTSEINTFKVTFELPIEYEKNQSHNRG